MANPRMLLDEFTENHLKYLELHFEQLRDHGILVTFNEFCNIMETVIGDAIDRKDLERVFNKVDNLSLGHIDWLGFITHIVSEMQMKEQLLNSHEGALRTNFKIVKPAHQEPICAIDVMPAMSSDFTTADYNNARFVSASKDGCIRVWSPAWQLLKSKQCNTDWAQRKKTAWTIHMTCLPNAHLIAVATAKETINFYEYSSAKLFDLALILYEIGAIATCLHYWFDVAKPKEGYLTIGDSAGRVTLLQFLDCLDSKLFGAQPNIRGPQYVSMKTLLQSTSIYSPYVLAQQFSPLHDEWVKQVMYINGLKSTLSCSIHSSYSMILQSTVLDKPKRVFSIERGMNCFDYNYKLSLIASGGIDRALRIWNPSINSKSIATFHGHSTPIIAVAIIADAEQMISLSVDKSLKVWDLKYQICSQSILGSQIPTGPNPINIMLHYTLKRQIILATSQIIVLDRFVDLGGGNDYMHILSHPRPLVGVLYSDAYNIAITACELSVISIWSLETGKKGIEILDAHSIMVDGAFVPVMITAMALDESRKSLITAGKDSMVKMWNLSNGSNMYILNLHHMQEMQEITAIVTTKNKIYFTGWNRTIYYSNTHLDSIRTWAIKHEDDILAMVYIDHSTLATCSWDGKIIIWMTDLGAAKKTLSLYDHFKEKNMTFTLSGTSLRRLRKGAFIDEWNVNTVKKTGGTVTFSLKSSRAAAIAAAVARQKLKIKAPSYKDPKTALIHIKQNPPPFICMLSLKSRKTHINTGNLLVSNMNGLIEVWSVHLQGGPLAVFTGVTSANAFTTCMTTDQNNYFLYTGDSKGYIRVWYIRYYHNAAESQTVDTHEPNKDTRTFPFMKPGYTPLALRVKKHLAAFKPEEFAGYIDINHPPILTCFQAHISPVVQIAYIESHKVMASASTDQSVRLWTRQGRYLATFGDTREWDLTRMTTDSIKSADRKLPFDIRQSGSAVSLQIELGGISKTWSKVRELFLYLYVKAVMRRKRKKSKATVAIPVESGTTVEYIQRLKREQELLQMGPVMGKNYKFKKCPLKSLTLPPISKAKKDLRAVYAYVINYELEPFTLEKTLNSLNHENSNKLAAKTEKKLLLPSII